MPIRSAQLADAAGITAIYNTAVENTTAIWNETVVDVQNRRDWLTEKANTGFPVFVAASDNDEVLGYAAYGPWRAWDGYRFTVEHSVYVREDQRGQGIGIALMRELIDHARQHEVHVMVAGIESENVASIRLHERLGFSVVGELHEVGTKFGRWLDLTFMQLNFSAAAQ